MPYAVFEDLVLRYPHLDQWGEDHEPDVNSGLIYYAEMEINGLFASHYTVPFPASDTHPTIKDLTIDLAYYRTIRLADPEKAEDIKDSVMGRIQDIKDGKEFIYTGSGTAIKADESVSQNRVWSSTGSWHPTMGMSDYDSQASLVSSGMLDYEENQRDL